MRGSGALSKCLDKASVSATAPVTLVSRVCRSQSTGSPSQGNTPALLTSTSSWMPAASSCPGTLWISPGDVMFSSRVLVRVPSGSIWRRAFSTRLLSISTRQSTRKSSICGHVHLGWRVDGKLHAAWQQDLHRERRFEARRRIVQLFGDKGTQGGVIRFGLPTLLEPICKRLVADAMQLCKPRTA